MHKYHILVNNIKSITISIFPIKISFKALTIAREKKPQRTYNTREFKKLRRELQGKRHIKIELCVKLSLLRLFLVDHVVQIGGGHFRLLGTNGFHVKAKNERFTSASSRCRQNLKYEIFTSSFGRLRQNIAPKSVPHVQHDYFFFIQPIKSLICDVFVDVAVVKS